MTAANKRRIVATAALPYANGPIHIGHLLEYFQADFWTRFQKMRGHECLYICADDTHGTPIMVSAQKLGITPEQLIAKSHQEHFKDFSDAQVVFDNYHSTNAPENKRYAEEIFLTLEKKGHIAKRSIDQLFCEHDKMFLPDRFVKGTCPNCGAADQYGDSCDKCGATYAPSDLKSPRCAICGTPPVLKPSEHLFFKLDHFRDFLRDWCPKHVPPEIANKLKEWLDGELRDWDISRAAPYFGFEIPGHPGKYFYVWLDAPIGYIASTQNWCDKNGKNIKDYWFNAETEIYHFIGKDIVYFHTLFWPAMLHAAGIQLPRHVFIHGHITVNGEKMSKSKGTSITARNYLDHLDPMYLRYYYATKLSATVDDLDFSTTDFIQRVNSDLIGKITNLGSRGAQMLGKRLNGTLCALDAEAQKLVQQAQAAGDVIAQHYEAREFAKATNEIRALADEANRYFDEKAPWKTADSDPEGTRVVLTCILNVFRAISIYLQPVLPVYADDVAKLFNEKPYSWDDAKKVLTSGSVAEYKHLATRIDPKNVEKMMDEAKALAPEALNTTSTVAGSSKTQGAKSTNPSSSQKSNGGSPMTTTEKATTAGSPIETAPSDDGFIDIDLFTKVDLRVAKIVEAKAVPEADKLLQLTVDLGEGKTRNIFAGIKSAYQPESLNGRLTVVVANLRPRKMKFGMSEGMVLAAGPGGKDLFILSPDSGAKPGDRVK
jgi:methionyl-tRNA synthetase